jgi:hypothetical protein
MLIKEELYYYTRAKFPCFVDRRRWILAENSAPLLEDVGFDVSTIKPETTSLFLLYGALPGNFFQRSEQLHVLKLYKCQFRFSSPPFLHCKTIRFLGLNQPKNLEEIKEEGEETDRWIIEFFSKPICARHMLHRLGIDFTPKYNEENGNKH